MYYQWDYRGWDARDVGVGADGTVYVTGTGYSFGGYGIFRWNGNGWIQLPGGAVAIAAGPQGVPWHVNSINEIYSGRQLQ